MSRVLALVEGETEIAFVKTVLAPELAGKGVFLSATKIGSARGQSGIRSYESNRRDILAALKQDQGRFCTTMLDYYGMPDDWPGRAEAREKPPVERAVCVEARLGEDIAGAMGPSFDRRRFVPYVQMHEFEAILFSNPHELAAALRMPAIEADLAAMVTQCGSPEEIDDGETTAPAKRIRKLAPQYNKIVGGILAAQRIGLAAIRRECRHFDDWVKQLETLP